MKVTINKSQVRGKVRVPPSKSQTIRGLTCAALARGESEIIDPLVSEDTHATVDVLGKIGVHIQRKPGLWRVNGGIFKPPVTDLFCGESATTLRFMTAVCALVPGKCRLLGGPSLFKRPILPLVESLKKLGVKCSLEGKTPPVTVEGGALTGGTTEIPGNISSQFISALLLIAPLAEKEVSIRLTTELESKPYVLMTLGCLRKFGIENVRIEVDKFIIARQKYQPAKFEVEGDWSSASYFLALGAVSEGIEVENLSTSSLQGDRVILDFLRSMGARVRIAGNSVTVSQGRLKGIRADLSNCIDLLPTVSVLAALADGVSEFTGIERARLKESNRLSAVREGLEKAGISVVGDKFRMKITGFMTKKAAEGEPRKSKTPKEGTVPEVTLPTPAGVLIDSRGDHRIAMAFGVLGTAIGGLTISQSECAAKTFPQFWDLLKSVGGKIKQSP